MSYTPATIPDYAHLLSGILPRPGATLSTGHAIPPLHTGRVPVDPLVRARLEELLSAETLQPYLDCRRRFSKEELVREIESINLAARIQLNAYHDSAFTAEHDHAPLAPTGLGRHFPLIEQMHQNFAHFRKPPRIGQFGIGLDPYNALCVFFPEIADGFHQLNLQAMGSTPEAFELATVGNVTAYEWDAKVIAALQQNIQEGIFYDNSRAARWVHPRMRTLPKNPNLFDPASEDLHQRWQIYVEKFFRSLASKRLGIQIEESGRHIELGALLTFHSWVKDLIKIREVDLITDSLWPSKSDRKKRKKTEVRAEPYGPPFDIVWATMLLQYHPGPLQLAALVKMVDTMKLGGWLFVDRFLGPPHFELELVNQQGLEQFLNLLGLEIDIEYPRPLETTRPLVIAERVEKTRWHTQQMATLKALGMTSPIKPQHGRR